MSLKSISIYRSLFVLNFIFSFFQYHVHHLYAQGWHPEVLPISIGFDSDSPDIAASENYVHLVWEDGREPTGREQVYYIRSTDSGQNWMSEERLSVDPLISYYPKIAANNNHIHIFNSYSHILLGFC